MAKLEDVRTDEEPVMRTLCNVVGDSFEGSMLDHHKDARERLPLRDREFSSLHTRLSKPVERETRDLRTGVAATDVRGVETVLRSSLERFGYPVGPRFGLAQTPGGWHKLVSRSQGSSPRTPSHSLITPVETCPTLGTS
jgi:hypothetical protein